MRVKKPKKNRTGPKFDELTGMVSHGMRRVNDSLTVDREEWWGKWFEVNTNNMGQRQEEKQSIFFYRCIFLCLELRETFNMKL